MTTGIRPPFKFLDPYTKADRDIFFGRDRETDEIHSRLLAVGHLLVYGVSGCGKTSLVQCGLANKFEPADCLAITVRRGANLLDSLAAALSRAAETPQPPDAPLAKRVRSLYLDHFKPIHLIFDQLEELFIFGDREERAAFGLAIKDLAALEQDLRLIFVVREEYLAAMTEFEPFLPDLFRSRIRIERMDRFQAREAIEGPCRRRGVSIAPGLAEEVLTRLAPGEATVELTWLQVVMDRFYRQAVGQSPDAPALTQAGLATLGRFDNVLGRFLEEQLTALDAPQAGEAVLKALVSGDGTRRPLTLAALAKSATVRGLNLTAEALQALVQHLIAARILSDRDEHGNYELRHDSLARKVWERMTAREKELLEIRQTIEVRYRDYQRRGLLLDADTLTYLAAYEDGLLLPPGQATFVKASREAVARKRRRRLVWAFSALILVLLVVSGLGVFGYLKAVEAEQKAAKATQEEKNAKHNLGFVFLEKAERSLIDKRFNEARLYALYALANFDPQRAGPHKAIGIIVGNPVYPLVLARVSGAYHFAYGINVSFSPDGKTLASGSDDNTIRLLDLATGKDKAVLAAHSDSVWSVSFSPDGQTLASLASSGGVNSIRLWDLSFLHDPRPIEEQLKAAEAQFNLHLVDLELQPIPPEENPDATRTQQPPQWSKAHPYHWLPAAERGDPQAMLQLALIYDRADDLPRAETWYRKAADAGAPTAKERLDALERRRQQPQAAPVSTIVPDTPEADASAGGPRKHSAIPPAEASASSCNTLGQGWARRRLPVLYPRSLTSPLPPSLLG